MKILCATDIHNHLESFQRILIDADNPDLVLLGGDLTNFGTPEHAENLVHLAQSIRVPVLAVSGNCDSAKIDQRLAELGVSVSGRGMIIDGIGIHGLSAAPPWRSGMYDFEEHELARHLEEGYMQIENAQWHVVLSHVPPRNGKLDRTRFFQHVGSLALREFIDQKQPALVICGHIHEARGVEMIGGATVVNCGPAASGYYAMAELGEEVRVELHRC